MKLCKQCEIEKPMAAFSLSARSRDGHQRNCKSCAKQISAQNRIKNKLKIALYDAERDKLPHRKLQLRQRATDAAKAHPERRNANLIVQQEVRAGRMERLPCLVCGAAKTEAHHPDYDRPLDVIWLCAPHHRQTHSMVRA